MSTPVGATQPDAVRRKVEAWLAEADQADAIALTARPEPLPDPVLTVGGTRVRVVPCPTPLAARAALHDRADGERLVLLTELTDSELGDGVLAHLSKQTVRKIDPWDVVRQIFGGVRHLDPTLVRVGRWVADALTDHAPPDGWPAPPGAFLTRDHALRSLASELLDLPPTELDDSGLVQWSTDARRQLRFTTLPDTVADGVTTYLTGTAGRLAGPVMAAVRAGHGVDVIPLGLLAGLLWPAERAGTSEVEAAVGRTRLEPWFGGLRLSPQQADALHRAAEAWIYRTFDSGDDGRDEAVRLLRRAEAIAREIGVTGLLGASTVLPSGFTQRLRAFADAVRLAVPAGGSPVPGMVARAQTALAAVEAHRAAEYRRLETARMAVRLLRWLHTADAPAPATLLDALHRQVRQDGWVDRARLDVFAGDPDPQVAEAYRLLHQAVDARRARHDQQFAVLLAAATKAEAEPGALLRVEDVLDRVVQPIIDEGRRVLLLVLDGMGVAAATELAESITRSGTWVELTPAGGPRTGVLAALPTLTEASRCSLFSGRLAVGGQQAEQKAFKERFPTGRLLHKKALRAGAGAALDPEVLTALGDPATPVVAAVINAIDDALDRSDPGTAVWGQDTITAVDDLLASAADRIVVIVSDHGHVVDRGPESVVLPSAGNENRWRPASSPAGDAEVAVTGSRVLLGGGSVVLPWREEVRYGPRKAGYHGGAAPAEAVIPLLVLTAGDDLAVPGWAGAPVASPDWWREPVTETAQPSSGSATAGRRRARRPAEPQPEGLFDLVPVTAAPVVASAPPPEQAVPELVTALLSSERYAQRRDPRTPLADERVAALLGTLIDGGGRATVDTLAARAGVPAHRINGTVTALRRLLQVEGYPVITLDPDGRTVHLNRDLLVEQFELESR
ncbi:BREX-2 system phosphatase PglZ [Micromonospora mirobrigensis]|uniref:PglZ domain-containing protein n=1 Tax=Micromonospora mirobrigensis TaxID=262898 RepID=A0A1C5AGV7_9ACTN|nr:BREX-2 system phosphatase PglZ [Micromonospora mirobrigensis]SCF44458.1 PglZ domain-containing protein [Micromonospora mirobrigensis]